ncbi:MAG TPA: protoporphyrinogen oxidase [Vicinamibacterales bacterium]|nr:protoporphyrinogen oxidase [Vicinamibacterales bacterium]
MSEVVIVGGGIAGLATAYELKRRGIPFVLLERGARAGGVILSEEVDGFVLDGGPDALLIQKPDGIALCHELGIGDRLVPTKLPRLAYIQRGGRLHALPAASVLGIPTEWGPFIKTRLFSWPGKIRMGMELFVPPRQDDRDESIGAFMTRRFGREASTYLAEPLLAGIHAGDVDRLSIRALFPRFVEAERKHGSLLKAFRPKAGASAESRRPNPDGAFKSLPGGLSELVRALLKVLPADAIQLNTTVTRVSGDGPYIVEREDGARLEARAVVLAAPAYATAAITRDFDAELSRVCGEIPYASAATIALAFKREQVAHPLNGSGFVVPRVEKTGIMAGSWLSSKWPHRAPEGSVLLRTFVGGARDPRALEQSDRELVDVSMRALAPLVGITGPPLLTRVFRWNRANAQHEVGHLDRLAAIDRAVARHPGVFVTGSGFRGTGIPDCVADGRNTAGRVDEYLRRDGNLRI